jgi:hypothetical protein
MPNSTDVNLTPEEEAEHQQKIMDSAKEIYLQCEALIARVEEFIKLSNGDLSLVIYDLKRLNNFVDAVIEAHPIEYKLSEMITLLELDEPIVRKLFKDVGVDLDVTAHNLDEIIFRKDVIALFADRAGSKEGKILADFLRGDSPEIVWG